MAVRTSSSSGSSAGGWVAVITGVLSVLALPLAIYLTRFSDDYELLDAAVAIPVAAALAFLTLGLARRAHRREAMRLAGGPSGPARAGRLLGVLGVCLAMSALLALGVYWLLDYAGSRG